MIVATDDDVMLVLTAVKAAMPPAPVAARPIVVFELVQV